MNRPKLDWKPEELVGLNVRRVLPKLMREYFRAGRKLDSESSARHMHRFRLRTKQLRYTLEAFDEVYGRGLESKIATLRPIQNALGDANDCEVLLADKGKSLPSDVRNWLEKRADEKRKDFLQYWREEFDVKDSEKKWERFLMRPSRTGSARKQPA